MFIMTERNFQKKLGAGMSIFGWFVVLALLTFYFSRLLEKQHNPNQNIASYQHDHVKEIRLKQNRAGHYIASGLINNEPVVFVLDTGATSVSIPAKTAARLKLSKGPSVSVITANGQVKAYSTKLDQVNLGGIVLHHVSAHINPHMQGQEVLLGMSFLKHLNFSQQDYQLIIRQ